MAAALAGALLAGLGVALLGLAGVPPAIVATLGAVGLAARRRTAPAAELVAFTFAAILLIWPALLVLTIAIAGWTGIYTEQ